MAGLLDRLFGREPMKAVVGTGAYWMEHGVPLQSLSRDPSRRIEQALRLYTSNDHIYACESTIGEKIATVKWHLERDGETIPDTDAAARQCYNLLRFGSIEPTVYKPFMDRADAWQLTSRHMGLPGTAFWLLDQQDDRGVPARTLPITPSRVTPSQTKRGVLLGWIVDADRPDGADPIPLQESEVIRFMLEAPDFGHFGIGKAEAVWRKAGLSNSASSFAEGSMLTGGRKAHLIWPEGVTVEGDQWDQWINGLRNAQEDGSFTRRLTANKFPIGGMEVGQTLRELGLPDVSKMSQQDIYAIWKMPESQVGRTTAVGLNGGERGKYEEAALWQNAVEPRLSRLIYPIQRYLVDPFGLTLIVETPEFDDDAPLYEIAEKAKGVPHKADELRALVGLDPLDPAFYGELGQTLLMGKDIVQFSELVPVPLPSNPDDDAEMPAPGEIAGKARVNLANLHRSITRRYQPQLQARLDEALKAQAAAIAGTVKSKHGHIQAKPNDLTIWWSEEREYDRLKAAIAPVVAKIVTEVGRATRSTFVFPAKADWSTRVAEYVEQRAGDRIRGINTTTRDALRVLIADGISSGQSPTELGTAISEATQFDAARAEMIARTETGYAYNDTAIGTYRAFEVTEVDVIDGDVDEVCAHANGSRWTLEEASANPLGHPNCTRDFLPVVKATRDDVTPTELREILAEWSRSQTPAPAQVIQVQPMAPPPQVDVHIPQPIVNVTVPEQATPQVTVNVPEAPPAVVTLPEMTPTIQVNVPEAKASLPQEVRIVSMPRRVHTIVDRNKTGKAQSSVEEDA